MGEGEAVHCLHLGHDFNAFHRRVVIRHIFSLSEIITNCKYITGQSNGY